MTYESISELIIQLNRLNVDQTDYRYIVSLLRKAMKGIRVTVASNSTELYFRARVCNDVKPLTVDELKAPPAELVKGFQRCNPPGIPMFYSASKRISALLECNVKKGDKVYLGQWVSREPAPVNTIMSSDINRYLNPTMTVRESSFYTYVDTIFTRPIHKTFSNVYKITSAVTEVLTTGYKRNKEHYIGEDCTVGILYPSVANIEDSYNCAFHASFADSRFILLHVMELLVKSREGKKIFVEVTDNAVEFHDGTIKWLNNSAAITKLKETINGLVFRSNGKAWLIPTRDTIPTNHEINELLSECTNDRLHVVEVNK